MGMWGDKIQCRAVFIGQDGSMGYRNGQSYDLMIMIRDRRIWVSSQYASICPYDTMRALLKNWKFDW